MVNLDFRKDFVSASLSLDFIVKHPELIVENNKIRGAEVDVQRIVELDIKRRALIQRVDGHREFLNTISAKGGKPTPDQIQEAKQRKVDLKEEEKTLDQVKSELMSLVDFLPNLTAPDVPIGGVEANQTLREVGVKPIFNFLVKPHHIIGAELGLIDIERATKVAGAGFYYLKKELVLLRLALVNFFMAHLIKQGFDPVSTPLLANDRTLYGTGYFPFAEKDNFRIGEETQLLLIGTSEQTLIGQHTDEILPIMPVKYVAESACFRTEAGNYGKNTQGIIRVHQFGKVEQIIFSEPQASEAMQQLCLENEEWLLQQLKIPYQVVLISTGDMGAPGYKKYDLEAWLPSQERWIELTSNTNLTDFQTRRLNIRFRTETGKLLHPHTISATGFSDRLLAVLLEHYQTAEGSFIVPEVLQGYMGGIKEIQRDR